MQAPVRRTFVVTGSGRSGTEYITRTLTAAGLRCGHEVLFNPRTRRVPSFDGVDGDVSWLAAPFVAGVPNHTVVLHQLRDPFDVIASWYGLRFLSPDGPYSWRRPTGPARLAYHELRTRLARRRGEQVYVARDYERFVARHLPWVVEPTNTLDRCIRYWIGWNRMVEEESARRGLAYLRYRVDEVPDRWDEIAALLEVDVPRPSIADEPGSHPNTRPRHDVLTRRELVESPEYEGLVAIATRYGFDVGGRP